MGRLVSMAVILVIFAVGLFGIVWASGLQTFSVTRFIAFFFPLLFCGAVLFFSRDPLLFLFWLTLALLPLLGVIMPPARWQLSLFDFLGLGLIFLLIARKLRGDHSVELFPTPYIWIPFAVCIPTVFTSIDLFNSLTQLLRMFALYTIYIVSRHYIRGTDQIVRFHGVIALALAIVGLTVIAQKIGGISFQFYGDRPLVDANGILVQQGSGIFQDPQKAAQFIAVFATYLSVLWWRGVIVNSWQNIAALCAILISIPALLLTISRLAIASGFGAIALSFLVFGWGRIAPKIVVVFVLGISILAVATFSDRSPIDFLVPHEVLKRFETSESSAVGRFQIWKDSWQIFDEHPIAGVGPGNYQEYWLQENPNLRRALESGTHVPDQPENGYLHILYEVGILGTLGIAYFLIAGIYSIARKMIWPKDETIRSLAIASGLGLIVFLITFTTIFTASDARNALIIVFMLVALESRDDGFEKSEVSEYEPRQIVSRTI